MSVEPLVLALYVSVDNELKRVQKEKLQLDENGVLGDKFYAKSKDRLILITSLAAYSLAKDSGIELEYGSLGENILIDKDISSLVVGNRFKIGELILEITQSCTLCNGLSTLHPMLPDILKNDRGIFAKAVTHGVIKNKDSVII